MALIDATTLLGVADRAAKQYDILRQAFSDANQTGGGTYFSRITGTADPDIEVPLGQPYDIVDDDLDVDFAVANGTRLANIVTAMQAHFNVRDASGNPLQAGGWDGYLSDKDKRVSWYFNKLYRAATSRWMLAINVFSESDDTFGTVEVVAGPAISFTDGVNYGNGSSLNKAKGDDFAATQLKVVVSSMGGTQLDLRLSVKDVNDLPTTIDVSVPASSPPGTEISVGSTSDRFLDLTSVDFAPAGDTGTVGDTVTVRNLKERTIAL